MSTSVISFKRRGRRRGLHALALAAALALSVGSVGAGTTTLRLTGQGVPGLPGVTFSQLSQARINDAQLTSYGAVLAGTGVTTANNGAAWVNGALLREGTSHPALATGLVLGLPQVLQVQDSGAVLWTSQVFRSDGPAADPSASLWLNGSVLMRSGGDAPGLPAGVNYSALASVDTNRRGDVAWQANLAGSAVTPGNLDRGIWVNGTIQAYNGGAAPGIGGGATLRFLDTQGLGVGLTGAGEPAFVSAFVGPGIGGQGIWRGDTLLVRTGQQADGLPTGVLVRNLNQISCVVGPCISYGFGSRNVNEAGQVLYRANYANADSTVKGVGLWRDNTLITHTGASVIGMGSGAVMLGLGFASLNASGQSFWAGTAGLDAAAAVGGFWRDGLLLARVGSTVTDATGVQLASLPISAFPPTTVAPSFNDQGLVSFDASLSGTGVTTGNNQGLFITDGQDLLTVVREGQPLAGSVVVSFTSGNFNGRGQRAYTAVLADGRQGAFVYTPELRWRNAGSGSWDNAAGWTLGISPDHLYQVTLDPSASLTVTGPRGAVNVQSLTIGSGSGLATLQLAGGTLTAASAVQVAARGVLTGSGTVATQVLSAGEVRPDNLSLAGGLVNNGLVRGSTTGGQRLNTALDNGAAGWVQVNAGERLLLAGNAHRNAGTFDLNGGELRITQGLLSNQEGGRLVLNDARLLALDGLNNRGQLNVTFGESQVFGRVVNQAGGKIILSGRSDTTFHDQLEVQAGAELRVSAGSTAVFFGAVQQRAGALFTGSGTKFYEGGLAVGNSPGLGLDAGSVGFGSGSVYVAEIGGTTACTEACATDTALQNRSFDKYVVLGTLTLGGTLRLTSWNSFVAQAGSTYDLFDWGSVQGAFDAIDASGFQLAEGTVLDTSRLGIDGSISVQAVPEPGSWALMGLGLLGMAGTLQRRRAVA